MKATRRLTLLLALIMVFAMVVACGETPDPDPNPDDTPTLDPNSIAAARLAPVGTAVEVDGVVAKITYASGMKPSGFYLVDETASIYVYGDVASSVAVGNKITVSAYKTYWILEDEQHNAEKFGYKGCCQLENPFISANDGRTDNVFDKSWISETTVKELLETPVTEDITTSIYKVNALVSKSVNPGFINYYINDLDGVTGSYVYTQCNGSDLAWLEPFDGKICTVYLSVINAKSTSSGCIWRLLPVAVEDNGFVFDTANTPAHVVEYYGVDQFLDSYTGDPALEMITTVSSELLGFEGATLTYTSSNTEVAYFAEEEGKTIFHCGKAGTATITVTGTYNNATYSEQVQVTVEENDEIPSISVGEAIATENGTEVYVKGIVGPSLVNKSGFYLIDDTGVIAVQVKDAAIFETIAIGNEVIVKGTKETYIKEGKTCFGQVNLYQSEIAANYYGDHDYSTATFITDKTLADFYALNGMENWSTSVFVLKATVKVVETGYYTKIELTSGSTTVSLYCSSAEQYTWLKQFANQEVTMELAACNWNANFYKGCVLAVYTENGKILNELNFQAN